MRDSTQPFLELVEQNIGAEESINMRWCQLLDGSDGQPIIGDREGEGVEVKPLHPAAEQHAERLVGAAAFERVKHGVEQFLAGKLR